MEEHPSGREESESERLDRNLGELLQELRSAVLLIAPSSYHRMTFRLQRKEELVQLANRFTIAGLSFLAVAMTGAIVLITDVLFGGIVTAITGLGSATTFIALWYVLPLRRRLSLTGNGRP